MDRAGQSSGGTRVARRDHQGGDAGVAGWRASAVFLVAAMGVGPAIGLAGPACVSCCPAEGSPKDAGQEEEGAGQEGFPEEADDEQEEDPAQDLEEGGQAQEGEDFAKEVG